MLVNQRADVGRCGFFSRSTVTLALAVLLFAVCAQGQEPSEQRTEMPSGWKDLAAGPFFDEARKLFKPTVQHEREIVEHAWTKFYNDPQFVAEADWATLNRASGWTRSKWPLRITGTTEEEKGASKAQLEAQVQSLRERMRARMVQEESNLVGKSYDDVVKLAFRLRKPEKKENQAELVARWMDVNDWRQTSYQNLFKMLHWRVFGESKGPVKGARWSGFIAAPATGQYTLSQLRQYRGDPVMKIWVDGKLVMDSAPPGPGLNEGNPDRFRSQPVSLTAGQKTPLRVEIGLDSAHLQHIDRPDVQFGAGLLWESAQLTRQLVPESALSPPEGFGDAAASGLKGEYFEDPKLEKLVDTRLDPAIDMFWNGGVVSVNPERYQAVLHEVMEKFQPEVAAGRVAPDAIAHLMRLPERRQLAVWLGGQEEILKRMDEGTMARFIAHTYLLPGKEHFALLKKWVELRPQMRFQLDPVPLGEGQQFAYLSAIWGWTNDLAKRFQGPYAEDADVLLRDYLARPNGECNLVLAYFLAVAAQDSGSAARKKYLDRIDTALSQEGVEGDKRVTWLLARAFAKELFVSGDVRPALALEDLQSAFMSAQTEEYRFWALSELLTRLGVLGQVQKIAALLDEHRPQFSAASQKDELTLTQKKAELLLASFVVEKATKDVEAIDSYLSTIKSREKKAEEAGDAESRARYQGLIAGAEQRLADKKRTHTDKQEALQTVREQLTALRKSQAEAQAAAAEGTTPSGQ